MPNNKNVVPISKYNNWGIKTNNKSDLVFCWPTKQLPAKQKNYLLLIYFIYNQAIYKNKLKKKNIYPLVHQHRHLV